MTVVTSLLTKGPQYTAHQVLGELAWLGVRPTPSYVGEPECNGIMVRWIRTPKEEGLYLVRSPVFPARKPFLITWGANLTTVSDLRPYDTGFALYKYRASAL